MAGEDDGWVDVTQPKPEAADDGWVNVNAAPPTQPQAGPQGGLLQTIPQGIELLGSEQGRAKLWEGVKKFPGDFAQGMIDFVKTPGKAYSEGVTPDQEVEFGLNAALGTIGTANKFRVPRAAIEAITPHVQEFEAGVTRPVAEQLGLEAASNETIWYQGVWQGAGDKPVSDYWTTDLQKAKEYSGPNGQVFAARDSAFPPDVARGGNVLSNKRLTSGEPYSIPDVETLGKLSREATEEDFTALAADRNSTLNNIVSAKQAGIIGPDIPPPPAETPAASAQRAIPAASKPGDKITMTPAGEPIDAWEQRFNRYIDKTETPDDFKTLIKDMASQNNNFPEARAGNVAPEVVAKVAEAAGLDSSAIDAGKLRTSFRTDDEIRTVTTLLKKLGDDVQSAAELVRTDDSPESLAAFQAAIIKRDYALEATLSHTAALRAEWGRSGNALQEILRAQKGEDVLTGLLKDKGRSIDDLRDIARGLNGLDREQAAKVLTGMRGQAPHWFYWMWTQGLISGMVTHTKYIEANALYAEMERGLVTPLASIIGKAKQLARSAVEHERVTDAAIKFNDKVYTGANHLEALERAAAENGTDVENIHTKADDSKRSQFDSWITSIGRFIDSKEAAKITKSPHEKLDSSDKEFRQQRAAADVDRAFFGETLAAHYGAIAAIPNALRAAGQTIKSGIRVPLESEKALHQMAIAAGEKPSTALSRAVEPNLQPGGPRWGIWERILSEGALHKAQRVIGFPGDAASSIHVAFKVMGERANLETWAYNKTAAEGLSPTDPQFWQRRAYHVTNPSEKVLKDTVYQAYKDTFMQELGDNAKAFQKLTKDVPGLKWVFPFTHIPINLMKATYEYTPFAALDKDMRANILGENGGRAQDLAIARMTVGSSVMAYFTHQYMQGKVTSNYPTDPNERKDWALQGKPANSIQIGERWVSFERFGPAGDLAQIGAAIGSIAHRFAMDRADPAKGVDEAFSHAVWATTNAAANTIGNEVGFQSLRNFMDAIEDEKKGGSFASYQATSLLPFSSLLTQTASFVDPHMRVAKSMVAGLENRIPGIRETLLPKRDPLYGEPLENPGYHDILRSLPIDTDPVKIELERVNLHPTAPRDVIGGVKLTPEQYDRYQATAGPLVQRALTSLVNHPGWQNIPLADRADTLRATISAMRQQAATAMQIADRKLIQQGLQQRLDYITGKTNTPRPKRPPELPSPSDNPLMIKEPAQLGIRG